MLIYLIHSINHSSSLSTENHLCSVILEKQVVRMVLVVLVIWNKLWIPDNGGGGEVFRSTFLFGSKVPELRVERVGILLLVVNDDVGAEDCKVFRSWMVNVTSTTHY